MTLDHKIEFLDMDRQLQIIIRNRSPVELVDFSNCMIAVANEYTDYVQESGTDPKGDAKLYINEIKKGSIDAILAPLVPFAMATLPAIESVNSVITFISYLKVAFDYLGGKSDEKPAMSKSTLQNIEKIMVPVANDSGAVMSIGEINAAANATVIINLNNNDANAIQNNARLEIDKLKATSPGGKYEHVAMYWETINSAEKSKASERAIIDSIAYRKPVRVRFMGDLKRNITAHEFNLFSKVFIVDVVVEEAEGKPYLYKVTNIHDIFDKENN